MIEEVMGVFLVNVSGYSQINAINIPIEGVAAILLGQNLTGAQILPLIRSPR